MARKKVAQAQKVASATPDSFLPGSINWDDLIDHADHVRNILVSNNQPTFVNHVLDPPLDAARRGQRDQATKRQLQQAVVKGVEDYSHLFINDKTLFLT